MLPLLVQKFGSIVRILPLPTVMVPTLVNVPMVEAFGITREYRGPGGTVAALRGIDLTVGRGQLLAVRGRSGSGKTTLLNVLGGLDRPTSGRVLVDGREVSAMGEADLVELRRRTVAFVFQTFGLVSILSAAENVEVPLRLVDADPAVRDRKSVV